MIVRTIRALAVLLALTLVAAGCGSDDSTDSVDKAPEETTAETESDDGDSEADGEMAEDDGGAEEMADPGTIVDVAVANGSFATLVAAVQAADLVDTLNSDGPFTVFAPTDDAFATALDALGLTADELLADTELLTSVLTYHVIADEVPASVVVTLDGQSVATVNGAEVTIGVDGDTVTVDEATVTAVDVEASNGVIHVIDQVLLPS